MSEDSFNSCECSLHYWLIHGHLSEWPKWTFCQLVVLTFTYVANVFECLQLPPDPCDFYLDLEGQ